MPDHAASRSPLVLLANVHEWFSRSLESVLRPNGYAVLKAYTASAALEAARRRRPDAIILDTELPDGNVLALCRVLRLDPYITASTPILITTPGPIVRQQLLDALRAGANGFWGRPLDTEEFVLRLEGHLRVKADADRAREQGLVDAGTGLYNAQGLARRARELAAQADRMRAPLACLAVAVDRDDREDPAVEALGRLLRAAARLSDTPGRLGPAEFAVLAPQTDRAGAARLGQRLAEIMASGPLLRLRGGYDAASGFRDAALDPAELLAHALAALRTAEADRAGPWLRPFETGPRRS
jgi:PleD family two-component response regulator